jgi:hypothetical protein
VALIAYAGGYFCVVFHAREVGGPDSSEYTDDNDDYHELYKSKTTLLFHVAAFAIRLIVLFGSAAPGFRTKYGISWNAGKWPVKPA